MTMNETTADQDVAGMAEPSAAAAGAGADAPAPPNSEVEWLKQKAARADELWDRLARVSADFENFKKRAARERQEAVTFANEGLLEKLVPVLDNLEMALAAADGSQGPTAASLREGIVMIQAQLKGVLTAAGLDEIQAAGQRFDPAWHEAVSHAESAQVAEGLVLQQLRKGYKLRGRLLRPAMVVVAKAPAAS